MTRRPAALCGCTTSARCSSRRFLLPRRRPSFRVQHDAQLTARPGGGSACRPSFAVRRCHPSLGPGGRRPTTLLASCCSASAVSMRPRSRGAPRPMAVGSSSSALHGLAAPTHSGSSCNPFAQTGRLVVVVTSSDTGRMPWPAGSVVIGPGDTDSLVRLRRQHPDLALCVDDADRLGDSDALPVLREIAGLVDRDDGLVVVSTSPVALATRFSGIDVEVARDGCGLVLNPAAADRSLLSATMPDGIPRLPGRGVFVAHGDVTEVQVLLAEAVSREDRARGAPRSRGRVPPTPRRCPRQPPPARPSRPPPGCPGPG